MTELFIHESGAVEAPAIVFLHGVGNTGAMWRTHMAGLPGYHCLAPDLPGFGRSARLRWESRVATAERVAALIERRVPTRKAHIVGLSLGGAVAFELLRRRPELVDRVVIDGCAAIPTAAALPMKAGVTVLSPFLRWSWVARLVGRAFGVNGVAQLADFVDQMTQADPSSFRRAFAQAQDVRITPELLRADSPTLLVAGQRELQTTRASNRLLAEYMPRARSRMVPDAGHGWIGAAPELHLRMVRTWLADQPLPAELRAEDIQLPDTASVPAFNRPANEETLR